MKSNYQPKITRARFVVSPYTPQQMVGIGQSLIGFNFARWDRGVDANDAATKPLAAKYARRKAYTGRRRAVRDLNLTGRLRDSIRVLNASENKVTIGPVDGTYSSSAKYGVLTNSEVLTLNQRQWRMWAVSPNDRAAVLQQLLGIHKPVAAQNVRAA